MNLQAAATALILTALLGGCGGGQSGTTQGVGMSATGGGGSRQSTNWSGYVLTGAPGGYSQVSGAWTVPDLNCSAGTATESASWAGIGGATSTDQTLIQAGTEQDCSGGKASYYAWWEGYPSPSQNLGNSGSFPVQAGDQITVTIASSSAVLWNISIENHTAGWTFTTTTPLTAAAQSAEWIEEAPLNLGSGGAGQVPLSDFRRLTFASLKANGANPRLSRDDSIQLIDGSGRVVANPSAPGTSGDSFDICFGASSCD